MDLIATILAALFLLIPGALRADVPPPLSSYNWAVTASPNLATHPPPVDAIRKFMEQLEYHGRSNSETQVCSFRFVDLRHSGNLSLVVSLDDGRGTCGGLHIVDRTAAGFQLHYGLPGLFLFGIDDVNQVVRDIVGDGRFELIFDSEFTDYEGADHCVAFWPVIYAWDGSNYANVSAQPRFRPFYQQEIKTLQQGARDECDEATIAKIQRFLGAPPNTGINEAIQSANSGNPVERDFAIGVLSDIGTRGAKNYLRMLTKDKNRGVALDAKMEFAYRHFGKPPPEAEFLDSAGSTNQDQSAIDDDDKDQLAQLAEPWRFIVPPIIGDKLDLKASDSKWNVLRGFDSSEQCDIGIELVQGAYSAGGGLNYQAALHGKCVPAPPR
jgi:hypothetical protein